MIIWDRHPLIAALIFNNDSNLSLLVSKSMQLTEFLTGLKISLKQDLSCTQLVCSLSSQGEKHWHESPEVVTCQASILSDQQVPQHTMTSCFPLLGVAQHSKCKVHKKDSLCMIYAPHIYHQERLGFQWTLWHCDGHCQQTKTWSQEALAGVIHENE